MENLVRKYLMIFLFAIGSLAIYAQDGSGIKGMVKDTTGANIESGDVIVLSPADSSVLKGIHFWDGSFELLGIQQIDVLIKIVAVGYAPVFIRKELTTGGHVSDLGTIELKQNVQNLEGVTISVRRPMFERQVGKLVVNVDGTILSERGTLLELLKSAPNVIVKSSGEVIVVGKGSAIIYIDGQRLGSLEMLSSIPSNLVDRIEIIENPSARYDAEGRAVIEIITKQGAMNGYQIDLGLRGMARTFTTGSYWAGFTFRKDWFSVYLFAGQYTGIIREDEAYYRKIYSKPLIEMENSIRINNKHKFDTWAYYDMDFRLDSMNTLFTSYTFSRSNSETRAENYNDVFEDGNEIGDIYSYTLGNPRQYMHSISMGYNRKLDTLGSNMRVIGQYTNFDIANSSTIRQLTDFGNLLENSFLSENENSIDFLSAQVDYEKSFGSKLNASIGAKNSHAINESGIEFQRYTESTWITDSSLFNTFYYRENIAAAFGELSGKLNKFSYQLGTRYEWTTIQGNSFVAGTGVVNREYHNLFPNIQLSYDLGPDLILGGNYNYRIQRPSYQDLDPFVNFIDSLSSFRGNPQLLPSYTHNAELSLVYMEYASITLGYSQAKNPMHLTVEKDAMANTFSAITRNIESSEMYSIALVLPYEFPWWTTFNSFGYTFNNYVYTDQSALAISNEPTYYVNLYNEFRIPSLFNLELTYEYVVPGSQGFFVLKPYQSLGGSITRKFFKDQLTARFSVFDAFFTGFERGESALQDFNVQYASKYDNRSFMLTLTWAFNKLKNTQMSATSIDREQKERIKD